MRGQRRRMVRALAGLVAAGGALTLSGAAAGAQEGGYWMLGQEGVVHAFGADHCGNTAYGGVDIEPFPNGRGYWILTANPAGYIDYVACDEDDAFSYGYVLNTIFGDRLVNGEQPVSISAMPNGKGMWVFTNQGRAHAIGDAQFYGDMGNVALNGPVLDSVATPSGKGYWMVASDGGIFSFGDAQFSGSMGGKPLNKPVMSMAPDPDGVGYWLVASDGGIFSFEAPFYGSMGGSPLNQPVSGMVASPTGAGYLMVAFDGGIFAYGDVPFHGSLGSTPPAHPVVSVAARPVGPTPGGNPEQPEPPAEEAKVTSLTPLHGDTVKTGDTWGYTATTSGPVTSLSVTFLRPDGTTRTEDKLTKQTDGTWRYSNEVNDNWPRGTFQVTGIKINGEVHPLPAGVPTSFTVAPAVVNPKPDPEPPVFENDPPVITHPAGGETFKADLGVPVEAGVDTPPLIDVQASDERSWQVEFTATGLPPGLRIQGDSGWIQGTPTKLGTYDVTVTVTEAPEFGDAPPPPGYTEPLSSEVSFKIQVVEPSSPPRVNQPPNIPAPWDGGIVTVFAGQMTDPDGDGNPNIPEHWIYPEDEGGALRFEATGLPSGATIGELGIDNGQGALYLDGTQPVGEYQVTLVVREEYYWGGDPPPPGFEESLSDTSTFTLKVIEAPSVEN